MKILKYYSIALVFSTVGFAESNFYAEAGVSYVALSGASYQDSSGLRVTSSTKTASGVGYNNLHAIMNLQSEDRSTIELKKGHAVPFTFLEAHERSDRVRLRSL